MDASLGNVLCLLFLLFLIITPIDNGLAALFMVLL